MQPTVEAILFCDSATKDPATGKFTLVGAFDSIAIRGPLPFAFPGFTIYMVLANVRAETAIDCQIVSVGSLGETHTPLLAARLAVHPTGPLGSRAIATSVPPMWIKSTGEHAVIVGWQGTVLAERRIHVVSVE